MPGWRILAFLLALCTLWPAALAAPPQAPLAVQGRLALPALPEEPLPLRGEWGFAWQQYVDPGWDQIPARGFAAVPSNWNDVTADGKPRGENGWGSYVLRVDCPAGRALAIEALGERTASRLYVNGTLVAQHGEPGTGRDSTWAAVHNRVPITREFACPLKITLHVANFDHRAGGFVRPLAAGPYEVLAKQRESQVIRAAVLLSAYLLTGLVALIFYAVRRRERVPLVFGLFCLAMAVYTDMIGERLFLRPLPAQISWLAYMRVEYLSWLAAMALFLATLRGLFPEELHRRVVQGVLAALGLAALGVWFLPPGIYSYVALPGQGIAVLVGAYVAGAMLRAQRRTPIDARVLLAGMLAVLVTFVVDLFLIDAPRPDTKFSPVGFALFMFSPAVVIARRLSHALNAEERAHTLEENARLREDVERMSRHDLKTPLNSILGATRLLRDDRELGPDQRELVDVLQRAGMRMLEMVNLSLGLFKMETGSYDFRPQAVDLREVVTRVMVDLHSYADGNGVTLYLQGSDRSPAYVRAEEPLCYSIIANLVKNAVEAAGNGNRVTLSLRRANPVQLAIHNPGEVPTEIAGRFFDKYVTSRKSGGTGLGTYSARLMARAQQGDLAMATGPDGTTLTLTLQALRGELPLPQPVVRSEHAVRDPLASFAPREVLVVDDDEFTRLVTRRFLPTPPFRVETAANGQAAVEALQKRWRQYVLIDMEMPLRNGIDTVRWMREQEAAHGKPRCHVIMLSGNDDEATPRRALAAGADRFLVKPVSREQLLATMLELDSGLPMAELPVVQAVIAPREAGEPVPQAADEEILVVDPEWAEAFPGFLRGYRETVAGMVQALAEGDREDLQFLAHRAAGGLSAMGLHWAARQSRVIERDAPHAAAEELAGTIEGLQAHLAKVRIEAA